jgi:hypothetical protein
MRKTLTVRCGNGDDWTLPVPARETASIPTAVLKVMRNAAALNAGVTPTVHLDFGEYGLKYQLEEG